MQTPLFFPKKSLSLRSFITITVSLIVSVVLLVSIFFYYTRTSQILRNSSQESITRQLNQINDRITDQIDSIDSVIPLFMSNNMILDALESSSENISNSIHFEIEKQMSYIYHSTPLSGRNFTNSIYVVCDNGIIFHTYTSSNLKTINPKNEEMFQAVDMKNPKLFCVTLPSDKDSLFFCRNLFNGNTGNHIGFVLLDIDTSRWIDYCQKGLDNGWFISVFNENIHILSNSAKTQEAKDMKQNLTSPKQKILFQELTLNGRSYYVAAQNVDEIGFTSAVAAPKDLLLHNLNETLKTYLTLMAATIFIALLAAIVISQTVTQPVKKMILHINEISKGSQNALPPMKMYREFDTWANAFNEMLKKLDAYYTDNFQKQLLLKNAEIRALQSQMDPHFLFNVLNTIAWKAQMIDNEEIYQMVISLGELLKMNILSKDRDFVKLSQEMEYVRFYIYLQQMRFEDKISCSIQVPSELLDCQIPCFCIQPLVENAIVHGLEPKKGKGKLAVQIFKKEASQIEICIADNGVGFSEIPDVQNIVSSSDQSHTHIGLKNLDKRLELLFGSSAKLQIASTPNKCTSISFTIPVYKEDKNDI